MKGSSTISAPFINHMNTQPNPWWSENEWKTMKVPNFLNQPKFDKKIQKRIVEWEVMRLNWNRSIWMHNSEQKK